MFHSQFLKHIWKAKSRNLLQKCDNPVPHSHISTYVDYEQSGLYLHNNNKDDNNNNKLRKNVLTILKFKHF